MCKIFWFLLKSCQIFLFSSKKLPKYAIICFYMQNMQICTKSSKYANICKIRLGVWTHTGQIRIDPKFGASILSQTEYAKYAESCLYSLLHYSWKSFNCRIYYICSRFNFKFEMKSKHNLI